jgi:nitrogen regulatory protein PII
MQMIEAVVKPNRLDAVKTALVEKGILGATALECKGFGKQRGHSERYRGPKLDAGFVPKVLLKVCVKPEDKDIAVRAILTAARTGSGEIGDGKIFVYPIAEVIRVRSGETGAAAV